MNQYQGYSDESRYMLSAAEAAPNARAAFLKNVYVHLFGAVVSCIALTAIFMSTPAIQNAIFGLFAVRWGGAILLFGMMAVTWLASSWAHNGASRGIQYAGLGLSVFAEAVIFALILPL